MQRAVYRMQVKRQMEINEEERTAAIEAKLEASEAQLQRVKRSQSKHLRVKSELQRLRRCEKEAAM